MPAVTRRSVLAVDDDPGVLEAYRLIFETDYEVLTAAGGDSALDVLLRRPVDVVLLDMRMPGLGGLAVLDALQQLPRSPNVVVVTAVDDARSIVAALRLGARDYITKPFDADELALVVGRLAEGDEPPIRAPEVRSPAVPQTLIVSPHLGLRAALAVALRTRSRVDSVAEVGRVPDLLLRMLPDAVVLDRVGLARATFAAGRLREQVPASQVIEVDSTNLPSLGAALERFADALRGRHGAVARLTDPVPGAVAYIAAHYASPQLEAIAGAVGRSSRQLRRVFAEQLHTTVHDFVTRTRIEAARCLLRETDNKIDVIAERVGLYDAPHLARLFKQHGNGTPASYRR